MKAAEARSAVAMNNIGLMYANGEGFNQDYSKALDWFMKAVEAGNLKGMKNVGDCYYYGRYVKQNFLEALDWYRKAVEVGDENTMNTIKAEYKNIDIMKVTKNTKLKFVSSIYNLEDYANKFAEGDIERALKVIEVFIKKGEVVMIY